MPEANVAVFGATGVVGAEMVKILEERRFPVQNLRLLASKGGRAVKWRGRQIPVEAVGTSSFQDIDIALFAVDGDVSKEWAPVAA